MVTAGPDMSIGDASNGTGLAESSASSLKRALTSCADHATPRASALFTAALSCCETLDVDEILRPSSGELERDQVVA